jgi:DNA-binding transcriptional ArsR family regulator
MPLNVSPNTATPARRAKPPFNRSQYHEIMEYVAMNPATRERACDLFGALAHPVRMRIVEFLCEGERTVGDVAAEMKIGQSGASQHLAILARAGVLVVEPRGTSRYYRVRGPRIKRILVLIEEFCQVHSLYGSVEEDSEGISPN